MINDVRYETTLIGNTKLFEATSTITLRPTKEMHNATFSCEAWNEAGDKPLAYTRVEVSYAPSVTIDTRRQVSLKYPTKQMKYHSIELHGW